jgi:hypothetical protein
MHRTVTGLALAIGLVAASAVSAGAQQYGGYNSAPPGSYQQSCVNVQMRGSTLSASCSSTSGQRVYSSLNVNGCSGDIGNNNGHLACNGNYGYNNGSGYGYNGNNGYNGRNGGENNDNDRDDKHARHHHPNGNAYGYYGNGNQNGYGNNGNSGYGGYGYNLPGGSYQQSCTNQRMNGSVLSASCTAANGSLVNSSIDLRRCQSRDIANRNGYLSC